MARRRARRRALARHSAGDRRPGARDRRGAGADRHRARSDAGRNGPVARDVHRPAAEAAASSATAQADVHARTATCSTRSSERYGVSPRIIVAIWGLESNFGKFSGVRPTIGALATLAWDPRRSTFFRGELLSALEILDRGDIDLARMRGSWAGAMGQPQFMPSSYLKWAEDFDGDGRTRHLVVAARRLRVDRELPEGARLDGGTDLGTRGEALARGREDHRERRRTAQRLRASRGAT